MPLDAIVTMAKNVSSYDEARPYVEAILDYILDSGDKSARCYVHEIRCHHKYNPQPAASPQNLPRIDWGMLPHDERVKRALQKMEGEGLFKKKYYYTWPWLVIQESEDIELNFETPGSFVEFLKTISLKRFPSADSLKKAKQKVQGCFPEWSFPGEDTTETHKRINCGRRFLKLFRTGE